MTDVKTVESKRPGEKLVRVYLSFSGGIIRDVRISGDFFIHPEEGIEAIELSLRGVRIEKSALVLAIDGAVTGNSLQLVGISRETIVETVLEAASL